MKLTRRNEMLPFLRLKPGELFIVLLAGREVITIKGDDRDCITVDVYYAGESSGALPAESIIKDSLSRTPTRALIGAGKAFDDLWSNDNDPIGRFFILNYGGQKEIAGGKKFNQWDIHEIELSDKEIEATVTIAPPESSAS